MFGIHNYTSFVAAVAVFQMIPGPGTLVILNATARHGVRSGMGAVFGTLAGDFLFMLGAVLGLATALAACPVILSSLQWAGIVYLCWLGLKLILSSMDDGKAEAVRAQNHWACFRQAFAVCLTNPKAILFFLGFFPLFLTDNSPPQALGIMMVHVSVISLLYQTGLVLVGNLIAAKLSGLESARLLAKRLAGIGLLGFGVKLAIKR